MYRILINLSSIKRNPNAGSTRSYASGPVNITFEYEGEVPDYLIDGENFFMESWTEGPEGKRFTGVLKDHSLQDKLIADKNGSVTVNSERNVIHHMPEPSHHFNYEDTNVQCGQCEATFDFNKLESDENELGGYSATVCPECEAWHCCELDVEQLDEALIRKEKIKNT